jgi:DNA-directed RNA polymerase subunit beta
MNKKILIDIPMESKCLQEDIITIVKYLIELSNAKANVDDIDHLSNRRVEQLEAIVAIRVGFGSYG